MAKTFSELKAEKESVSEQSDEFARASANQSSIKIHNVSTSKRKFDQENSPLCSKEMKMSEDKKPPMEFTDMCDNVIDIILYNLDLEDLASISDTNSRLKNIAASVFSRKYGDCLTSFDTFHYSYDEIDSEFKDLLLSKLFKLCKSKQIIRVSNANIWFKLLRNFGQSMKFIRIERVFKSKIPNAVKNLFQYVLQYCTDSLEILEMQCYPFFAFIKPLNKLQEFHIRGYKWTGTQKNWNPELLNLMPNIRFLNLQGVPKALEKHFPKLERVSLNLDHECTEQFVQPLISFLRLNPQITYLKLEGVKWDSIDLIYATIEENQTQLKNLKIVHSLPDRDAMVPILTYRLKTVEKFSCYPLSFDYNKYSFEFNELKKIHMGVFYNLEWINLLMTNKKLKILKFSLFHERCWKYVDCDSFATMLTKLPELEQIIVESQMDNIVSLKTALGNEWKQIELKESGVPHGVILFKSKFQRTIPKKGDTN